MYCLLRCTLQEAAGLHGIPGVILATVERTFAVAPTTARSWKTLSISKPMANSGTTISSKVKQTQELTRQSTVKLGEYAKITIERLFCEAVTCVSMRYHHQQQQQ